MAAAQAGQVLVSLDLPSPLVALQRCVRIRLRALGCDTRLHVQCHGRAAHQDAAAPGQVPRPPAGALPTYLAVLSGVMVRSELPNDRLMERIGGQFPTYLAVLSGVTVRRMSCLNID